MTPESRYATADSQFVVSHAYTDTGTVEVNTDTSSVQVNARLALYRLTVLPLPDPPPMTTRSKVTSYMHLYAEDQYGDAEKWWLIADANPQIRYPLDLPVNTLVYLP